VEKRSIHGNINSNSDYISLEVKISLFKTANGNKFPGEQAIVWNKLFKGQMQCLSMTGLWQWRTS